MCIYTSVENVSFSLVVLQYIPIITTMVVNFCAELTVIYMGPVKSRLALTIDWDPSVDAYYNDGGQPSATAYWKSCPLNMDRQFTSPT